ncbi:MAG: nicotinate (nicotinamide) nucleotide adenylyltransferase [Parachlamydiaceae bacterium]|nr:nicotinate (nicotinamide) nucleotide adenylyltransferase [Parachlamydiaceae bacterium]
MTEERIGIYGGSFNPIHFGHLNLAIEMLEKHNLTKVYFCPAALSPFKQNEPAIEPHHRLTMVKMAIEGIPQFSILENELLRPPPSYMIDTLEELLVLDKNKKIKPRYFLILGGDAILDLHRWHRIDEILALASPLTGMRPNTIAFNKDHLIQEAVKKGVTLTRVLEISSTELRVRIGEKKYCSHLLPTKVLDYIYSNRLYWF